MRLGIYKKHGAALDRRKRRCGGWVVAESVVASAIGLTFLVGLTGIFMSSSLSFVEIGNYTSMDRSSRYAMDRMTTNIRNAKLLTQFAADALVFKFDTAGTTNLTYRYDAPTGAVTEEWNVAGNTTTTTLLTGCTKLTFSLLTRDMVATSDVSAGQGKIISVDWQCVRKTLGRKETEDMQQAQIVIRNQP